MNRRSFLAASGTSAFGLPAVLRSAPTASGGSKRPVLMKLGCQTTPTTEAHLKYLARYGVRDICAYPNAGEGRIAPTLEELSQMKDLVERNGITIGCLGPSILESNSVESDKHPAIMLADSPERDRDIEQIQLMIRNCAQVGIPAIKYNMTILGILRTEGKPGRGDATYNSWQLRDARPATPLTRAGRVTADRFWERITYFLDRVIPVAEEYKIRMACHPHDPGVPPEGYQGVDRVLGTVSGLKRFVSIRESPYHGLNFCQGTVSEMLANPGQQIFDVIRYFGERKKIFNVHFRNIRGHRDAFEETFPDEGDVDMVRALATYRDVGYPYMIMPDHVPFAAADPHGLQSFAFCYGYIRGLIQSLQTQGRQTW